MRRSINFSTGAGAPPPARSYDDASPRISNGSSARHGRGRCCHYCSLNWTVTVITTGIASPFNVAGLNFHCCTALSAAGSSHRVPAEHARRRDVAGRVDHRFEDDHAFNPRDSRDFRIGGLYVDDLFRRPDPTVQPDRLCRRRIDRSRRRRMRHADDLGSEAARDPVDDRRGSTARTPEPMFRARSVGATTGAAVRRHRGRLRRRRCRSGPRWRWRTAVGCRKAEVRGQKSLRRGDTSDFRLQTYRVGRPRISEGSRLRAGHEGVRYSAASVRAARRNTSSIIPAVSLPVFVFWRLG